MASPGAKRPICFYEEVISVAWNVSPRIADGQLWLLKAAVDGPLYDFAFELLQLFL